MLNLNNINSISELRAIESTLKEKIKFLESEINPRQEGIFTCKEIIQLNENQLNELNNNKDKSIVVSSLYKKEDSYWIKKTKYNIEEIGKAEAKNKLKEAIESTKEEIEFLEKYILINGEPLLELNKMIKDLNNNHKLLREVLFRINNLIESPITEPQTIDEVLNKTRNNIFRIAQEVVYKNAGLINAEESLLNDIAGVLTNKCEDRVFKQLEADYKLKDNQGNWAERFLNMAFIDDYQIRKYLAESSKEYLEILAINDRQREIIKDIFQFNIRNSEQILKEEKKLAIDADKEIPLNKANEKTDESINPFNRKKYDRNLFETAINKHSQKPHLKYNTALFEAMKESEKYQHIAFDSVEFLNIYKAFERYRNQKKN